MPTRAGDDGTAPTAVAPPPSERSRGPRPGTVIDGRFEIGEKLGAGGMGAVFRAHDRELDQAVAVKFLMGAGFETRSAELERFRREAALARMVSHPSALRVFEFGESEVGPYLVMELVLGESMETRLQRETRVLPDAVMRIVRQVLEGLGAAHAAGVVHRDVKPANVICEPSGRAVLADFGIARLRGRPGITRTGAVVGTPEYMAPELLRGGEADVRSNLFGVGALVYTLLVGAPPKGGLESFGTSFMRLRQIRLESVAGVPAPLRELADACLRLDPAERPQTAAEALAILAGGRPGWRARRRRLVALASAVAVAATAGAVGFSRATARRPGYVVDAVTAVSEVPPETTAAAQDLLAAALAGHGSLAQTRVVHLHPFVSTIPGSAGFRLAVGPALGEGTTLDDAAAGLVRAMDLPSPLGDVERRLAAARAALTSGAASEVVAALGDLTGDFQAALLRALVLPSGSPAGRAAASDAAKLAADLPRPRALARGVVALHEASGLADALAAVEKLRGPTTVGDAELAIVQHRLLLASGRKQEALAVLEAQTHARPGDPLAFLELARAQVALADCGAARRALDRYLAIRPGAAVGHALRGECALAAGDEPAASAALARADTIGPDIAGRHLAVRLAIARKDWSAAREAARRGLATAGEREASLAALAEVAAAENDRR